MSRVLYAYGNMLNAVKRLEERMVWRSWQGFRAFEKRRLLPCILIERRGGRRGGREVSRTKSGAIAVTRISLLITASDDGPNILTWLLRIARFTHSDCSKVSDEEYVTGKYSAEE